ncbi:MAG TPA: hypothetical protein VFO36_09340, partial [Nitrospiraceae bacterium]|nr:hypothetical protein [Nitrospiraceae bacterium]
MWITGFTDKVGRARGWNNHRGFDVLDEAGGTALEVDGGACQTSRPGELRDNEVLYNISPQRRPSPSAILQVAR